MLVGILIFGDAGDSCACECLDGLLCFLEMLSGGRCKTHYLSAIVPCGTQDVVSLFPFLPQDGVPRGTFRFTFDVDVPARLR